MSAHAGLPQINLYDSALQEVYDPWSLRNVVLAGLGVFLVMLVWAGLAQHRQSGLRAEQSAMQGRLDAAQTEVRQMAAQIAARTPDAALERELQQSKEHLEGRMAVLGALRQGLTPASITPADVLRGLARQVPSGLWLTAFQLNMDNGVLDIRGRTTDPARIAVYVADLGKEKAFAGRTFAGLELVQGQQPSQSASAPDPQRVQPAAAQEAKPAEPALPPHHQFRLRSTLEEPKS